MNPNDLATLTEATALAQRGEKSLAYAMLKPLLKINSNDVNLLLWIAFTAPDLTESEFAIIKAGMVDPNHPGLASARNWLASAFAAFKAQASQSSAQAINAPSEQVEMDDEPTTQLPIIAEQPVATPGFSPRQQATTALVEPPQVIQQVATLPVTKTPAVTPDRTVQETPSTLSAINWEQCYPHLYEQLAVPAWAKPVTIPEPPPVITEPKPEPSLETNITSDHSRQSSRWAKAVKGFFAK